jgi:hypothetical protein
MGIMTRAYHAFRRMFGGRVIVNPLGVEDLETQHDVLQSKEWSFYQEYMRKATERRTRYEEAEKMDEDDLAASVLDLYAESSTQPDVSAGKTVWVTAPQPDVAEIIDKMFNRIELEDHAFALVRSMLKYGDDFEMILTSEENGIEALEWVHPKQVDKDKDRHGTVSGFKLGGNEKDTIKPWDMIHFKMLGRHRDTDYGDPFMTTAATSWKRLRMSEDQAVVHRLRTVAARDVAYIEVGDVSVTEAHRTTRRVMNQMRRDRLYDPASGKLRSDINPLSLDEMIGVPTRLGQKAVEFERLPGEQANLEVADLIFFLKRFLGNVRIPPAFFGFDEGGLFDYSKSLVQHDIRFARGCKKVQRAFLRGLIRLAHIQLAYRGIDIEDPTTQFTLSMVPVSFLDEQQRQELLALRLDVMGKLNEIGSDLKLDKAAWFSFVLQDIGGFPPEIINKLIGSDKDGKEVEGREPLNDNQKKVLKTVLEDSRMLGSLLGVLGIYNSRWFAGRRETLPKKDDAASDRMDQLVEKMKTETEGNGNGKEIAAHDVQPTD